MGLIQGIEVMIFLSRFLLLSGNLVQATRGQLAHRSSRYLP